MGTPRSPGTRTARRDAAARVPLHRLVESLVLDLLDTADVLLRAVRYDGEPAFRRDDAWRLLERLARHRAYMELPELGRRIGLTRLQAHRVAARLARRHLVDLDRSPFQRRATCAAITPRGRRELERDAGARRSWIIDTLPQFPPALVREVQEMLQAMRFSVTSRSAARARRIRRLASLPSTGSTP